MSALCVSVVGCPTYLNPAVKKQNQTHNKTIVLLLSQSVSLPQQPVPMAHKLRYKPNLILIVTQLFSMSCVLLTERQNHVLDCYDWPWREIGNESPVFAGKTGSVCLQVYALFWPFKFRRVYTWRAMTCLITYFPPIHLCYVAYRTTKYNFMLCRHTDQH